MRVHKGSNWTTFNAVSTAGELTILMRRVYHPTDGEQAQIEIAMVSPRTGRNSKYTTKASATMTPDEAKTFCTVLLGAFAAPAPVNALGPLRVETVQAYQPVEYANKMTPREAAIAKKGFLDGYDYRDSLHDEAKGTKP